MVKGWVQTDNVAEAETPAKRARSQFRNQIITTPSVQIKLEYNISDHLNNNLNINCQENSAFSEDDKENYNSNPKNIIIDSDQSIYVNTRKRGYQTANKTDISDETGVNVDFELLASEHPLADDSGVLRARPDINGNAANDNQCLDDEPLTAKPRGKNKPIPTVIRQNPSRRAKEGPKRYTQQSIEEMSTYDQYNYQAADTGHRTGRATHSSDNYHASDNQRQQLQDIAAAMASLCNIGNSCYMNSVIYTLRFAPSFLHNLHHLIDDISQINSRKDNQAKMKSSSLGRNINGIHGQNARSCSSKDLVSLGSGSGASSGSSTSSNGSSSASGTPIEIPKTNQQVAIEQLHELFQNLHRNEANESLEPFQSDNLLKAIQDVNPIFEGNQQQDAHEFLMCILDSLRETNQSLTKVIFEHPKIINNGFVSIPEQAELSLPAATAAHQPQTTEKKSTWFRKSKSKEDKHKVHKSESLARETESVDNHVMTNALPEGGVDDSKLALTDKDKIQEQIKKLGLDFFSEDFEGTTMSSTRCLSCETVTEQKETMIDLSVAITANMENIDQPNLIQNLCITREQFRGDNKYRCEECSGYTEAIRTISYPLLPRLLIIQLKRFSGGMEKINNYIPTPFTLQCFCSKCCELPADAEKLHEYRLYSVITHVGATMSAGHYVAYTCSLDLNSTYINCPKDLKRKEAHAAALATAVKQKEALASSGNGNGGGSSNSVTGAIEKNLKKIGFRRYKAPNNADFMKQNKNVMKITNGIDKLNLVSNLTASAVGGNSCCPGGSCCCISMHLCNPAPPYSNGAIGGNGVSNNGNSSGGPTTNGVDYREHSRSSSLSSYGEHFHSTASGASSTGSAGSRKTEPLWYQCDDDKIKVMPQPEFQEMLLPNRKNTVTPYLLFYARNDVQGLP